MESAKKKSSEICKSFHAVTGDNAPASDNGGTGAVVLNLGQNV